MYWDIFTCFANVGAFTIRSLKIWDTHLCLLLGIPDRHLCHRPPSFLVVLWICILFHKFKNNPWVTNALQWLKPIIIGMIGAAAVILITPDNFVDWKSWMIFAISFIVGLLLW